MNERSSDKKNALKYCITAKRRRKKICAKYELADVQNNYVVQVVNRKENGTLHISDLK